MSRTVSKAAAYRAKISPWTEKQMRQEAGRLKKRRYQIYSAPRPNPMPFPGLTTLVAVLSAVAGFMHLGWMGAVAGFFGSTFIMTLPAVLMTLPREFSVTEQVHLDVLTEKLEKGK